MEEVKSSIHGERDKYIGEVLRSKVTAGMSQTIQVDFCPQGIR